MGWIAVLLVIFFLWLFVYLIPVRHWIAASFSNVKISVFSLIGMRLRRVPPQVIVDALIQAQKAGLEVTGDVLEAHYLAGGNVEIGRAHV